MIVNEWYAYTLFMLSYGFVYSIVIPYEQGFLQEKFGDAYLEYKAHTGKLRHFSSSVISFGALPVFNANP